MKTKKLLLVICSAILMLSEEVFAQNWQWANQIGSSDQDGSTSIVGDNANNLYVSGGFRGGACYFQTDTFVRNGFSDFFLMKYDSNGNEVWVKKFGGNNTSSYDEGIGGICFDSINNFIYITGCFSGNTFFGSTMLSTLQQAFFLAKFDLNGNCIWAKQSTGAGQSFGGGVALDNSGDVYVCGSNSTSINLDSYTIPAGGFIAKYDASGNCLWAKNKFRYSSLVTSGTEAYPQGIKIFNSTILICGNATNDTIIIDTVTALFNTPMSAFLAAFDINANIKWLKLAGGGGASGYDLGIDNSGNSYLGGIFAATGYFDTTVLTNPMQYDAFLAKYDINGQLKWVKQLQATGGAWGNNVSTNSDGTTYATGYFSGTATFDTSNTTASSGRDMFAVSYDSLGVCLGVKKFGLAEGFAIYSKDNNSFWVSGKFGQISGPPNTVTIGSDNFTSYGSTDIFVAKSEVIIGIQNINTRISNNQLAIYANPNKGICNVTVPEDLLTEQNLILSIYSSLGKLIQQIPVQVQQEKIIINLEEEAKGIYNITLGNSKKMYSGKIVFE